MQSCVHCGHELPDDASYCNQCWRTIDGAPPARNDADPTLVAEPADDPALVSPPPSGLPTFEAPFGAPTQSGTIEAPTFPSAPPPVPTSQWATEAPSAPPSVPEAPSAYPPPSGYGAPGGFGASTAYPAPPPSGYPPPAPAPYGAPGYAPPPYPNQGYMMQPQYGMPGFYGPPPRPTNGMAIGSLVCSLLSLVTCAVTAPVGVILGHIALSQIKRDQSEGKGLAIAGLVIGYLFTIALVLGIVLLIVGANQNNS